MSACERISQELEFTFLDTETVSNAKLAQAGCFGVILVPAGSDLIGKDLQFLAHSPDALYADTSLLSTAKTLAAGANPLTADEVAEVGAVKYLKLSVNSAVDGDATCVLLWKS